jgi:hypothetical protein
MSKYGLSVLGKIRVFRKDKEIQGKGKKSFTVHDVWFNVSEKDENDNYFNKSMNLIFKRDLELPENNTVINIISAFPVITGQGDYRRIALLVEGWEPEEKKVETGSPLFNKESSIFERAMERHRQSFTRVDDDPFANNGQIDISDDDLPF